VAFRGCAGAHASVPHRAGERGAGRRNPRRPAAALGGDHGGGFGGSRDDSVKIPRGRWGGEYRTEEVAGGEGRGRGRWTDMWAS
jgi:hypothetical protein